jgi:hypothetical protein
MLTFLRFQAPPYFLLVKQYSKTLSLESIVRPAPFLRYIAPPFGIEIEFSSSDFTVLNTKELESLQINVESYTSNFYSKSLT